jgi:3-hydroxymyristoyl/3-hydroxydecanoyl-(acyl carrier protein) dehydratase
MIRIEKDEISNYLNITDPFLMLDYVDIIMPGKIANAVKILNENDWFFKSHLPNERIMPGTLQAEAMLQSLVLILYHKFNPKNIVYVTNCKTKFHSKVSSNFNLYIYSEINYNRNGLIKGKSRCEVDNKIVSSGDYTFFTKDILI